MFDYDNKVEDIDDQKVERLLDLIYHEYGYDFRHYSRAHMTRRIQYVIGKSHLNSMDALYEKISTDGKYFQSILPEFSINVTEMFRDPEVFAYLKSTVLPWLSKREHIRIWHAGCASGEEVYSLAILIRELGFEKKTTIIGTDFDEAVLKKARLGVYPLSSMVTNDDNYLKAGGGSKLSDYYKTHYDLVVMDEGLREGISFTNHNLVKDHRINQVDLIMCRNVMIYFDKGLQSRVLSLLDGSLKVNGIMCLGSKETLEYTALRERYEPLEPALRLYHKES